MRKLGFKLAGIKYRMVIQGYGRLGLFDGMRRVIEGYNHKLIKILMGIYANKVFRGINKKKKN